MLIRVLSYNMHRAIGVDRLFRPERIAKVINHHQADIVLLQEVDVGVPRSKKLDLAKEMAEAAGYPHYATGLNVKLRKGRYGNATLSKFPIVHSRNINLTVGKRKARGCLHSTIEINNSIDFTFANSEIDVGVSHSIPRRADPAMTYPLRRLPGPAAPFPV